MTRVRPTWPGLPEHVRDAITAQLGGPVTAWVSHDGGMTPGWALSLESGVRNVFVKVASTEFETTARMHRREAQCASSLPDGVPAPTFQWILELPDPVSDHTWVVVASDAVDGRAVHTEPWDLDDLDRLQLLAQGVARYEVPVGGAFPSFAASVWPEAAMLADERPASLATFDPWLAANLDLLARFTTPERQTEALAGPHLIHGDLRADNALIVSGNGAEKAVAVDWPHAARGASFVDQIGMLPSVHATGGPAPGQVLDRVPVAAGQGSEAVTVWVAVLTAYFVRSSLLDPPSGIPHIRAFQRAQAEVCIPWLRSRLSNGW